MWSCIITLSIEDDGDDEAIDTEETRHDNGYDGLEDEVSPQYTHAADANTWLSSSVSGTQI